MAHRHCLRYITPSHFPPLNNAARAHTVSAAMRGPPPPFSLKLIPSNITTLKRTRINRHRPPTLCLSNSMGDEGGSSTTETRPIEAPTRKREDEEPEKSVKEVPPPPPEKPEPGDCCGSGCVRCVWDVYYDELDEYNKLYKSDSTSNS